MSLPNGETPSRWPAILSTPCTRADRRSLITIPKGKLRSKAMPDAVKARKPDAAAEAVSSAVSVDLPIPASPSTRSRAPRPERAPSRTAAAAARSLALPIGGTAGVMAASSSTRAEVCGYFGGGRSRRWRETDAAGRGQPRTKPAVSSNGAVGSSWAHRVRTKSRCASPVVQGRRQRARRRA